MKLRDLEYLVAIDEERHFNRAAERCFVSQPTLSGQIKKLEEQLGVVLIERSTRHVVMTEAGEAVVAQARRVLNEAKAIVEIAGHYKDPLAGDLQLGLIPTVAPYLLPGIMPKLQQAFPRLRLWLHEQQTHILLQRLELGELDLLILALPVAGAEAFSELALFNEAFYLAVPEQHEMAKRKTVSMADLQGMELMLLEEGHCLRDHALEACALAGVSESSSFRASSLETLRHMVGEGMGVTLIPELALPRGRSKTSGIRYLPFSEPLPSRRIGMLYRKGSPRTELFTQMAGVVSKAMSKS